ncbi:SDR family NAD(P)-dependent oxidoreductase [Klebsiella pneumoniae subsp. pneumoniae]|nr:SDR family NAD(P)-dependent oxidoreductase [Klebsiella pneumoniae subsp. pneumoniae]
MFINNAGTAKLAGFLASTPREHQAIHIRSTPPRCCVWSYAALAAFTPRRRGTLINIASYPRAAYAAGQQSHSASESLVLSFTRGLQEEFADSGVRIQAVIAGGDRYRSVADLRRGAGRLPSGTW